MYCVTCAGESEGHLCPYCGQAAASPCCPGCGAAPEPANAAKCGCRGGSTPATLAKARKNKWAAFILCLFLGFLGAHKFYEGRIGMGILYLLTCGLFSVGWFFDCIILLTKPDPYYI